MKRIVKLFLLAASMTALLLACSPEDNGGGSYKYGVKSLVNTQWASSTGSIGMSFEEDDWAFFSLYGEDVGSGQFTYDAAKGVVDFDVFFVISDRDEHVLIEDHPLQIEITDAELTSASTMTIYFHEIGDTEEYAIDFTRKK